MNKTQDKVKRALTYAGMFTVISLYLFIGTRVLAEDTSTSKSPFAIGMEVVKVIFTDLAEEEDIGPTNTPTPPEGETVALCSDTVKYPYSQYGLDYYIPIKDPTVNLPSNFASLLPARAKSEYYPQIVSFAKASGWNPAFLLAIWIEETGGSASTCYESGGNGGSGGQHVGDVNKCSERTTSGCGRSHFGYDPFGRALCGDQTTYPSGYRPISEELRLINRFMVFNNDQFANFTARHSGSIECTRNGGDVLRGICTGNPFSNNPNYLRRLKETYDKIIPQGLHGASQTCEKVPVPAPTEPESNTNYSPIDVGGLLYYPQCKSLAVPDAYWSSQTMTGCSSFCGYGCGISSSAMIYSSLGTEHKNPKEFLALYISKRATSCGIEFPFPILRSTFESNNIETQRPYAFPQDVPLHSPTARRIVDGYLQAGLSLYVYGVVNGHNHAVWIVGKRDGYYLVMDPYWGAPPFANRPNFPKVPFLSKDYTSFQIHNLLPVKKKI